MLAAGNARDEEAPAAIFSRGSLSGSLEFLAETPQADRRCRLAVAPARCPLPVDHHRLVRPRRIPPAYPAGPSCGRRWTRNLSPVES